jgi:MFS family permease
LLFATAVLAVAGLTGLATSGGDPRGLLMLAAAATCGVLFVIAERRRDTPLVDLAMLRRWELSAGLLAAFLTFIALASNMFLIPFALQDMMGHSAATAGLVMMTVPLAILPVAPLAGLLADRRGSRLPTTLGLAAISLAIFGMARFDTATSPGTIIVVLGLYGLGAGLFQAPNNSAVLGAAPEGRQGVTVGMLALSRNLGQICGIVIASTVWDWRETVYRQRVSGAATEALEAALRDAFLVLAGFGLLALIISALRVSR